jgi:hypothetical protein
MNEQITVPDWLLTLVGRHVVLAEAQRVQSAAVIAALQQQIADLTPPDAELEVVAEPNGQAQPAEVPAPSPH